jgi:hypothetical protein
MKQPKTPDYRTEQRFTILPDSVTQAYMDGTLTQPMYDALLWLYGKADWATGIVKYVSSARIEEDFSYKNSARTYQDAINQKLHNAGWVTSHHVQGHVGPYAVTINNYVARSGAVTGQMLNPRNITSYKDPAKSDCGDACGEKTSTPCGDNQSSSPQKMVEKEGVLCGDAAVTLRWHCDDTEITEITDKPKKKKDGDFSHEIPALKSEPETGTAELPAQALVAPEPGVQIYAETDSQGPAEATGTSALVPANSLPTDSKGETDKMGTPLLPAHMYQTTEAAKKFSQQFANKLDRKLGEYWAVRVDELINLHGKKAVVKAANNALESQYWAPILKAADDPIAMFAAKMTKFIDLQPRKPQEKKPVGRTVSSNYDTGKTVEDHAHLFAGEI